MTNEEKFEFEKQILMDVENDLIRRRLYYILDITKNQREDIETLFKYIKYVTIYAILINLILAGVITCLIITN